MQQIVVTDLTRFKNKTTLCLAGVTLDGKTCLRPLPYQEFLACKKLNLLPGSILAGDFSKLPADGPHVEDVSFSNVKVIRACTSEEFRDVLQKSQSPGIDKGFGTTVSGKVILVSDPMPTASIITLRVAPDTFAIGEDGFGKLRGSFTDSAGKMLSGLSVTDLGFFEHVGDAAKRRMTASAATTFIRSQKELYLRIGLSRRYKVDSRDGYWAQINGIYTFPDYATIVRKY